MARKRASDRDIAIPDVYDQARRAQIEQDDAAWLQFYLPDVFYNPFTEDHLETIADVGRVLGFGTLKCTAAERGDGKSSIVKYLMIKYALQKKLWFPLIIAATGPKAAKTTGSVRARLASKSPTTQEIIDLGNRGGITQGLKPNFLAEDYPLECFTARYVNPSPMRARNITANGGRKINVEWGSASGYFVLPTWADECPLGPIFMSLGWSSDELQGCNIYDRRPDAAMLDDLDSRDSLAAQDGLVAGKIEEQIETTIAGLGGPGREFGQYFLCTIPSIHSAAAKYSDPKQKPAWNGSRKSAIKAWPTRMDMWDKYIELWQKGATEQDPFCRDAHQFYVDNQSAMDAGSVISNPYRFSKKTLPDGSQKEISSLQRCFNYIAKHGRDSFETEHQNNPPLIDSLAECRVSGYHVSRCAGDFDRGVVDDDSQIICRGIDVRKIELHHATVSAGSSRLHRIADYDVQSHGTTETTVEMAEKLILSGLHQLADTLEENPLVNQSGDIVSVNLTLVDKGWLGSWTEDGVRKTWVGQPVDKFCLERGPDRYMPAKGQPNYRTPEKSDRLTIVGDNWHINRTIGSKKSCDEVIWNAEHFHSLVEELFLIEDQRQAFELFHATDGVHSGHKRLGEHIREGAEDLADSRRRNSRSRKPKYRRDHWWDALAMSLVAMSIESFRRTKRKTRRPTMSLAEMQQAAGAS